MIKTRGSGILLHITSLASEHGIGDMGHSAYKFADFLHEAKQKYWQILPVNPVDPFHMCSPYQSSSAFAGNHLLISPELLIEDGLLSRGDIAQKPAFPSDRVDFSRVIPWRDKLLDRAFQQFKVKKTPEAYDEFVASHSSWLDDFVLFNVIKSKHPEGAWNCWEPRLRDRERAALIEIAQKFPEEMNREKFRQFVFYRQWSRLKDYCNKKGISIIGDIPIYMRFDSADVWANQSFFILDVKKNPKVVSGVPPDYFSKTGQLWGHPVYNWNVLRKNNFDWWVKRVRHNLELFDLARLDHFRGFAGFWTVPAKEKTAVRGKWLKAPGEQLFRRLLQAVPSLPIIAEDLGVITDDVIEIMQKFGFPGMKILLFSFGSDFPKSFHIPHNLQQNCVLYTGTHDNNTAKGWFEHEAKQEERERVFSYLGRKVTAQEISFELTRLAFMSVATTVIIPMQDLLGLGQDARMNVPATIEGNWQWQLKSGLVTKELTEKLLKLTVTYGRD